VLAARGMRTLSQAVGLAHREPELIIPEDPEPIGAQDAAIDAEQPSPPEEVETVYIAPDVNEVFDIAAEDA
jgi:hypothetical protein